MGGIDALSLQGCETETQRCLRDERNDMMLIYLAPFPEAQT
jgi:hypothetical protein